MNIAAWLLAMVAPLVVRAVIGLGFTVVAFTGVNLAVSGLVSLAQSSWSAMPVAVLQLCALSGIPEVLGMVFGALSAVMAMKLAMGATRYVAKLPGS